MDSQFCITREPKGVAVFQTFPQPQFLKFLPAAGMDEVKSFIYDLLVVKGIEPERAMSFIERLVV